MKLDEYVKQVLVDITSGVAEAQRTAQRGIAPASVSGGKNVAAPSMVKFEIVVSAEKSGGGGIQVPSLLELSGKLQNTQINKISFEVPVFFSHPAVSFPPGVK
jgi:hypothetical protein